MIIKESEAFVRRGDNIEIRNYITNAIASGFSLGMVTLDGVHPRSRSTVSDRGYLIIEGEAIIEVGEMQGHVCAGDSIYIPKNTIHSISGKVKYVVVNAPPFDPKNEFQE